MVASLSSLSLVGDRRNHAARDALLRRVRAEFTEMPCLRLTRGQAQRLFSLRPDVCERILAVLVCDGFLTCGSDDRYRLNDSATWPSHAIGFERSVLPPKAS